MPTSRAELAGAALAGRIYIAGGLTTLSDALSAVEVYDPASDSWSTAAPLPDALHHLTLAAAGGKLYAIGGYPANAGPWVASASVTEYNPSTDMWTSRAFLPQPRAAHAAVTLNGRIYVFGGVVNGQISNSVAVYDPASDTWSAGAPMPTAREHLAAAAVGDTIYVAGGRTSMAGHANTDAFEAYTPATDTWTTIPRLPTARSGLGATTLDGKVYVIGGEIPGVYAHNERYDPVTRQWAPMAFMPTARHGVAVVAADGRIYAIGGGPDEGASHSRRNEAYAPD